MKTRDDERQIKRCPACTIWKPFTEFGLVATGRRKGLFQTYCRACTNEKANAWSTEVPTLKKSKVDMLRHLAKKHQVPIEVLLEVGDPTRTCDICQKLPRGGKAKRLHIDHDHKTGKFRGLLCSHCNSALGYLEDDSERLRRAIQYLENTA